MDDNNRISEGKDKKPVPSEADPLIPQAGPSLNSAPHPERPRTVRHHRRTLSGRSIRSGHFQFGPSYHPNIYPAVNDPFTRQAKRAADRRARLRFVKALSTGIGLWVVVGLVLGWTGLRQSGWGKGHNRLDYGAKPSVPRSEGHPITCARFAPPEFKLELSRMPGRTRVSKASFSLPLSAGQSFFIHGQGSFAKGQISVDTSPSNAVEIEVDALYNDEALIDLMTVCHVEKSEEDTRMEGVVLGSSEHFPGNSKVGLGIYTPSPEVGPYPDSDLEFRIRIKLPNHLQSIHTLEVMGDLFAVSTTDLSSIPITIFDVGSTVASISIDKLLSHVVRIRTNNGQIEGTFNVSKSLSLATVNGAITANVALFSSTKEDVDISDIPPNTSSKKGGTLVRPSGGTTSVDPSAAAVHVTTVNGAVSVKYVEHPLSLKLFSSVTSTTGRAQVEHRSTYEGDFEVETTWGSTDIKGPFSHDDPAGLERPRQKLIRTDRDESGYRHIAGSVWWGRKDDGSGKRERGDTVVKTTLGSARVIFN